MVRQYGEPDQFLFLNIARTIEIPRSLRITLHLFLLAIQISTSLSSIIMVQTTISTTVITTLTGLEQPSLQDLSEPNLVLALWLT